MSFRCVQGLLTLNTSNLIDFLQRVELWLSPFRCTCRAQSKAGIPAAMTRRSKTRLGKPLKFEEDDGDTFCLKLMKIFPIFANNYINYRWDRLSIDVDVYRGQDARRPVSTLISPRNGYSQFWRSPDLTWWIYVLINAYLIMKYVNFNA